MGSPRAQDFRDAARALWRAMRRLSAQHPAPVAPGEVPLDLYIVGTNTIPLPSQALGSLLSDLRAGRIPDGHPALRHAGARPGFDYRQVVGGIVGFLKLLAGDPAQPLD